MGLLFSVNFSPKNTFSTFKTLKDESRDLGFLELGV